MANPVVWDGYDGDAHDGKRHRAWVATLWLVAGDAAALVAAELQALVGKDLALKYFSMQEEAAPSTGKLHLQSYFEFNEGKTLTAIQKVHPRFAAGRAWWAVRRGPQDKAIAYTKKEGRISGPYEAGVPGIQGERTDKVGHRAPLVLPPYVPVHVAPATLDLDWLDDPFIRDLLAAPAVGVSGAAGSGQDAGRCGGCAALGIFHLPSVDCGAAFCAALDQGLEAGGDPPDRGPWDWQDLLAPLAPALDL